MSYYRMMSRVLTWEEKNKVESILRVAGLLILSLRWVQEADHEMIS